MVNAPDERERVHEFQKTHDDAYFEADNRIQLRNLCYPKKIIYQISGHVFWGLVFLVTSTLNSRIILHITRTKRYNMIYNRIKTVLRFLQLVLSYCFMLPHYIFYHPPIYQEMTFSFFNNNHISRIIICAKFWNCF